MSDAGFDIIFRGDIVMGHQLVDVKLRLQQLFKTDAAKIDALFTGRPVPLKRNLDEATANKYREVLIKAGAQVQVVAAGSVNTAPKVPVRPAAPVRPTTHPDALPAAAAVPVSAPTAEPAAEPSGVGSWTLAPAGSDLLTPAQRAPVVPVQVDTSALSLREQAGNLIDASEVHHEPAAQVHVPDYSVAEAGADLVSAEEKFDLPLLEIDVEDWGIAPPGSDLLLASERQEAEPVQVDTSQFQLAPAGSDLGQLKPRLAPLNPDTSALKLVDEGR